MQKGDSEVFKNPIGLIRPLTVDPKRQLERRKNTDGINDERRAKSSRGEILSLNTKEFQSNSTSSNFSFASDEDYDTDLEDDVNQELDHSCIGIYKHVCKCENIVPVGLYMKNYEKKELIMRFYGLGSRSVRGFLPSLGRNTCITKLDLTSNGLGDKGILYLARILRDNVVIADLNLSHNFISVFGAREICDMFKDNRTINHLQLEGNLFNDESARLFAELISNTGRIKTLNLAKNKIGSIGAAFFGHALAENTTLESLDLSWNSIGGKGAAALIKGLQENVFLKTLNLAHNALSGLECGRPWANALKENTSLTELDLSHNRLTVEPAVYIGRGLARSESLQKIFLVGNPLESAGCYAILKPLVAKDAKPSKLGLIDLREMQLNPDFYELYAQVRTQRGEIRVLLGSKSPLPLVRSTVRSPIERLHALFQRHPQIDLMDFFRSVATISNEDASVSRITNHAEFKQAIYEKLNGHFSDKDIDQILQEIDQYDCKKFALAFDNKPMATSFSSASWRFKS